MLSDRIGKNSILEKVLREPIVHFCLLGFILLIASSILRPDDLRPTDQNILVNKMTIANYLLELEPSPDKTSVLRRLDNFTPIQKKAVIQEFLHQEVLYREAMLMGLDTNDPAIRQRLIQRMYRLIDLTLDSDLVPTDEEVQLYFGNNVREYRTPATATFTHAFIKRGGKTSSEYKLAVQNLSNRIAEAHPSFSDAPEFGELFLYKLNYIDVEIDEITSYFGDEFATKLFKLEPNALRWHGPLESTTGSHFVLLVDRKDEETPAIGDIRPRLLADMIAVKRRSRITLMVDDITDKYNIQIDPQFLSSSSGSDK